MIGVSPATTSAVDWGLVLAVGAVAVICLCVAIHAHILHRRVMAQLKRR